MLVFFYGRYATLFSCSCSLNLRFSIMYTQNFSEEFAVFNFLAEAELFKDLETGLCSNEPFPYFNYYDEITKGQSSLEMILELATNEGTKHLVPHYL